MTYPLLKKAPKDHNSPKFLDFLRANNPVVYEDNQWLVIENCKYHTKEKPWHTAFSKDNRSPLYDLYSLWEEYRDWEWRKKAKSKQIITRFHIHLIKKP